MSKQINSLQMRLFAFLKTVSGDAKANSKKERILEETGRKGWRKFNFGHTEFEMLVRYSSGENQQAVGNSNLQYESCYGFRDGVGYHYLLQVIFPIQGSNPSLLHWQAESLPSESPGKPVRSKVRFKRCFSAPRYFSFTLETESELFKVLYILVAF